MSSLDPIRQLFERYYALEFHQNTMLAQRLQAIQKLQKLRLKNRHATLFAQPEHQLLTHFFMHRLYGNDDIDLLAQQCVHLLSIISPHEHLVPASFISTTTIALTLMLEVIELDQALAQVVSTELEPEKSDMATDEQQILTLYQRANQAEARHRLLDMLDDLAARLDHYVHSTIVGYLFTNAKAVAKKHDLSVGYDFMLQGLTAMAPIRSMAAFMLQFTQSEHAMIERIDGASNDPLAHLRHSNDPLCSKYLH